MWEALVCVIVGWVMGRAPFYFRGFPRKKAVQEALKEEAEAEIEVKGRMKKQFENMFRYSGDKRGQEEID